MAGLLSARMGGRCASFSCVALLRGAALSGAAYGAPIAPVMAGRGPAAGIGDLQFHSATGPLVGVSSRARWAGPSLCWGNGNIARVTVVVGVMDPPRFNFGAGLPKLKLMDHSPTVDG